MNLSQTAPIVAKYRLFKMREQMTNALNDGKKS